MVKGKTKSGFSYEINPAILKDWDFLELVDAFQNGDTSFKSIKSLLCMLLTEDGFDALKEHIRTQNGTADVTLIMHEFTEICNNPKLKNSQASPT